MKVYNQAINLKKGGDKVALVITRKINYPKLRGTLVEKGIKQKDLATLWGCSTQLASNKLNGKSPMSECEAEALSILAKFTDKEKMLIFSTTDFK